MSTLETDLVQAATGTNTALKLKGKGSGVVKIGDGELSFPDADGSSDQIIKTDGSGALSFADAAGGGPSQATQAALEAETNEDTYAPPDLLNFHPGISKMSIKFNGTGTISIDVSRNVTSITDNGTGQFTVTIATNFSSANYVLTGVSDGTGRMFNIHSLAAGSFGIRLEDEQGVLVDHPHICCTALGDQ